MHLYLNLRRSLILASVVLMFASTAAAQQFEILRGEYGYGNRWVDVTPRLRELARADRTFRVSNDTFGEDPAEGRVKSLRIYARGPRGETRTFEYREGSIVDGSQFSDWTTGFPGRGRGGFGGGQYEILRAEYGYARQQMDVTQRLRDLARGDSRFRADNDTLGGDPAPGRVKTLRIYARGPRGETRTFQYREGSLVDGSQFADWNGGGGIFGRGNFGTLNIVSATYGAPNRNVDVTGRLRSLVRDGRLSLTVSNSVFDRDPAPNTKKSLWITYSVGRGPVRQAVIQEGDQLDIP